MLKRNRSPRMIEREQGTCSSLHDRRGWVVEGDPLRLALDNMRSQHVAEASDTRYSLAEYCLIKCNK